jgi:hypothetical protein
MLAATVTLVIEDDHPMPELQVIATVGPKIRFLGFAYRDVGKGREQERKLYLLPEPIAASASHRRAVYCLARDTILADPLKVVTPRRLAPPNRLAVDRGRLAPLRPAICSSRYKGR